MSTPIGRARACANIALAKYWGKIDDALNLPAVPSVSLTLDELSTETTVEIDSALTEDSFTLDGAPAPTSDLARAREMLDRIRIRAGSNQHARIVSANRFPTAAGLASSASGFAALAVAAARAFGLDLDLRELSAIARRSSASAARSVYGGFVELPAGAPGDDSLAAMPLAPVDHWNVALVIAIVTHARKKVGSRDGMRETARTSPYYASWLAAAPRLAHEVREGILARDLERVGTAMEASTFAMHASAWVARPPLRYFGPATLALLDAVEALRDAGIGAYATMDAGPHVKVLCEQGDAERVRETLEATGVAREIRIARPGPAIQ